MKMQKRPEKSGRFFVLLDRNRGGDEQKHPFRSDEKVYAIYMNERVDYW